MAMDRFLISFLGNESSLQTNLRPWLIADNAFSLLQNAYVWRGRIRKRFGSGYMGAPASQYSSRLRLMIGTTAAMTGNISVTVPGNVFAIGQSFTIGTQVFTVYQTGTPAAMKISGLATSATYNTNNGAVVITGATPLTAVYFYPSTPVMGMANYEVGAINDQP